MVDSSPSPRSRHAGLPVELSPLPSLPTAAERVAELIRERIFRGEFAPGSALPEASLASALRVSRTTVRDAYRMLTHEHLLVHEPRRGVTVRALTTADVRDIYALRRLLELPVIDHLERGGRFDPGPLQASVTAGKTAAHEGRFRDVGTENLTFHAHLVAVMGSPRTDQFFRRLMTELRLGFLAVGSDDFHVPYVKRNGEILELLIKGRYAQARAELASYLRDAERQVLAAVQS